MLKDYNIGLVINRCGVTDNQLANIIMRLKAIARCVETGGKITVMIPGFNLHFPELTIPDELMNLQYKEAVVVIAVPCHPRQRPKEGYDPISKMRHDLHDCDEVWCCPGSNQGGTLSRTRAGRLYQDSLGDYWRSLRYKLIHPWVSLPDAQPRETKKGKDHDKARTASTGYFGRGAPKKKGDAKRRTGYALW